MRKDRRHNARVKAERRKKAFARGEHTPVGEIRGRGLLQMTEEAKGHVAKHVIRVEVVAIAEKKVTLRLRLFDEDNEYCAALDFPIETAREVAVLIQKAGKTTRDVEVANLLGLR